jgi:hypothetical protein
MLKSGLEKIILKFLPAVRHFFDPLIYFKEWRIFHKITNSASKMTSLRMEGFQKKNLCAGTYDK